ncbi:MAG: hypothetical protein ACE5HD_06305 [Acidobacteriota bacterium]
MSVIQILSDGLQRVRQVKKILLGLWLAGWLVALPATWVVTASIHAASKDSLASDALRSGFDMGWFGEYTNSAKGITTTFTPTVTGAGAFYANLEAWASGDLFKGFSGLVVLGVLFALLWTFCLGGLLDRYADPASRREAGRYLQACGRWFFRLVRLVSLSGILYFIIYKAFRWAYSQVAEVTRDVTSERTVLLISLVVMGTALFLLTLVQMSFSYAKITTVLEDRRKMVRAALDGFQFVFTNPLQALGLYYTVALVSVVLLALYAAVGPGPAQSSAAGIFLALAVSQMFLLVRLMVRFWLIASEMGLYRDRMPPAEPAAAGGGPSRVG